MQILLVEELVHLATSPVWIVPDVLIDGSEPVVSVLDLELFWVARGDSFGEEHAHTCLSLKMVLKQLTWDVHFIQINL